MKVRTLATALQKARERFAQEVQGIAEQAHAQLLPYFQKRGWAGVADDGAWVIRDRHDQIIDNSKLPTAVREILDLHVSDDQDLGSFLRPIKRLMFCVRCGVTVSVTPSTEGCPRCQADTLIHPGVVDRLP